MISLVLSAAASGEGIFGEVERVDRPPAGIVGVLHGEVKGNELSIPGSGAMASKRKRVSPILETKTNRTPLLKHVARSFTAQLSQGL